MKIQRILIKRTQKRKKEIQEIISDLESFKEKNLKYKKAVEYNIDFFKSALSVFTYIHWLIFDAPKIRKDRKNLLELADFPFPKWQKKTHKNLSALERLAFPGLLAPIRNTILEELKNLKKIKKEPIVLLDIGSGAMELERQIICELLKKEFKFPIIFLGVEFSLTNSRLAFSNLSKLAGENLIEIKKISSLNNKILNELKEKANAKNFLIVILNDNFFNVKNNLSFHSIDLVFHSRLKHHLKYEEKDDLDNVAKYLAPKVIEFDDFYSIPVFVFPSIITWNQPTTLNGAILSYLRDYSKKELLFQDNKSWKIKFYNLGYYLRTYDNSKTKNKVSE